MHSMKRGLIAALTAAILVIALGCFVGCDPTPSGTFYTLQEAYEGGLLTREELMSIAYYHNGGRQYNEEIMGEEYTPIPKEPAELSEETSLQIRNTAAWELRHAETDALPNATTDGFQVQNYYGSYRGAVAVIITCSYYNYPAVELDISYEIGGVVVHYWTYERIHVWIQN